MSLLPFLTAPEWMAIMGEYTPIRNLKPGMKDLTLMFIVLDVSRIVVLYAISISQCLSRWVDPT